MKRLLAVAVMAVMMVMSFTMVASASTAEALGEGTHSVAVDLYHATLDQLSMGDPAVDSPGSITVDDGVATMTLGVHEVTLMGLPGYLEQLEYWTGSEYTDDDVVVVDEDDNGVPEAFIFPITAETDIVDENEDAIGAWQKVRITVNVSGGSMPVSPARLKIMF